MHNGFNNSTERSGLWVAIAVFALMGLAGYGWYSHQQAEAKKAEAAAARAKKNKKAQKKLQKEKDQRTRKYSALAHKAIALVDERQPGLKPGDVAGSWTDKRVGAKSTLTYQGGQRFKMNTDFEDGSSRSEDLKLTQKGFVSIDGGTDYYSLSSHGSLDVRDHEGLIRSATLNGPLLLSTKAAPNPPPSAESELHGCWRGDLGAEKAVVCLVQKADQFFLSHFFYKGKRNNVVVKLKIIDHDFYGYEAEVGGNRYRFGPTGTLTGYEVALRKVEVLPKAESNPASESN